MASCPPASAAGKASPCCLKTPPPEPMSLEIDRLTMLSNLVEPPRRDGSLFMAPSVVKEQRPDGSVILRSRVPLQEFARCVGDWLELWAASAPDRLFLAERPSIAEPWATITYREARRLVRSAAAWVLAQGMSTHRPLVILSENSIE